MASQPAKTSPGRLSWPGRVLDAVLWLTRSLAAVGVLACALLVTADIIGVWLFHWPVPSVVEICQVLLVLIVFFGLGSAEMTGAHIRVDIVREGFPRRVRAIADAVVQLVSIAVYLAIFAAGVAAAQRSWDVREVYDSEITVPVYLFRAVLFLGALIAAITAFRILFSPHRPAHRTDEEIPDGK